MPTRNVNLANELDRFVLAKVESGRSENASVVVRAALRMLKREEAECEARLSALRKAIDEGDASGIAGGNPFARVRRELKLTKPTKGDGVSPRSSRRDRSPDIATSTPVGV